MLQSIALNKAFQPATPTEASLWEELQAERASRQRAEDEIVRLRLTARIPSRNPNPLLRVGFDGALQFANPAADFLVEKMADGQVFRHQPQLRESVLSAQRSGQTDQRDVTINGKNYLLCTVPLPDEEHAMLYLTDVTDLHATREEVIEQKQFYSSILQHVPAVVLVLDEEQRYLFMSAYGEPDPARRQARLGTTFADYAAEAGLPARIATRRHRLFRRAVDTRQSVTWEEQWPATKRHPVPTYWQCHFQPVYGPDSTLSYVLGYGLNVTLQREAEALTHQSEEAKRAQEEFTRQVLELNPNLVYVRDEEGTLVFCNKAMQDLLDLMQQLAGPDNEMQLRQEEVEHVQRTNDEAIRTGKVQHTEARLTLSNGEVRWYQSVKCLLPRPDGARQVLVVSTDITALKAAQLAAEAAATARENFLANMSHEIRTPLNGVLGMANLLAKTTLSDEQRRYLGVVQTSGRHLLGVVNDVLDMAKITSGKLEMEQRAFDLCDSMGQAAVPLAMQAQEKGIRVIGTMLRESCPLPWVIGDSYRLNQILINLLSNAVKFTPKGGTITVGGYFVSETEDTLTTEFRVTDTGIGITPEKLKTIFEEFTQAYADTTRQFGGTGLGLSISRALVKQLGGTLTVQSTPGKGSSFAFTITLPKAPASARVVSHEPPALPTLAGHRVLLAEDNPVSSEVAQLLLAAHGVQVDAAASGPEALALFEANHYDAVLMDIQMPGMNGLEVTARLRQHPDPARAATPVLALTANAFRADTEKYLAAGMNDTLAKPFEEAELLEKLAVLLKTGAVPAVAALPATESVPTAPAAAAPPLAPTSVEAPTAPEAAPSLPYDLILLRQTAHGSIVFMNRILATFHANTPLALDELSAAVAAADAIVLSAVAHRLRPSLRLVGAAHLLPLAIIMEDAEVDSAVRVRAAQEFSESLAALLTVLPEKVEE